MGSEVGVPHSGIFGRRTFERGFEPGIIRRAEIGFFGFVCGSCGALPGRKGLGVLGLEFRKTDTTGRAELYVGTGGETRWGFAVVTEEKQSGLHATRGDRS